MKILSTAQIKACDAYTIRASGIQIIDLVERAATCCADYIISKYPVETPITFLCGMGNNGADGLATARILLGKGYTIKIFLLQHTHQISPECKINLNKILMINAALVQYIEPESVLTSLPQNVLLIDAVLGIGINRPVEGWLAKFFGQINLLPNFKIAIDIPSGMPADDILEDSAAIIAVNETLSFQLIKRCFLHPETAKYLGSVHFLDIGLNEAFINSSPTHYQTLEHQLVASFIKKRADFSYKNQHGHTYIIGGSKGKGGAAILATKAALRSGTGLVTSIIPQVNYTAIQGCAPEAMCITSGEDFIDDIGTITDATAIGIGIGMGMEVRTVNAFIDFVANGNIPTVFDADALNILAKHFELMKKIPENSILTPHIGECDRLFGKSDNSMQRVDRIRMLAMEYKVCIILKGHRTVIATRNGDCYYNTNGNAGMAKGGSGDVLTGLLAGLLSQGYTAEEAALIGVYLHGSSGDIAAQIIGQPAMNSGDLINNLAEAWQKL